MAVTAIWNVKGYVGSVVKYVKNKEKTFAGLKEVMDYATQGEKTEKRFYVSGINCIPEIAREQMMLTKKQYGKEGGNVAFHGYQSFKPGEVTPELSHEIGMKLAQELWGDRFQVVVATHLDKEHIHNHFVINSVSFKDSLRYNDCNSTRRLMMQVSDRLCREYGLSVIEEPKQTKTPRNIYLDEKEGKPTLYNVIRQDVDEAIKESYVRREFFQNMEKRGYEIKFDKYLAVKPLGRERFTRLKTLGANYTEERIYERITEGRMHFRRTKPPPMPPVRRYSFNGNFKTVKKLKGFKALYMHYMYFLGILPKHKKRTPKSPIFKTELRKLERYQRQFKLLYKYDIDSVEDLQKFIDTTQAKMDKLIDERTHVGYRIRRCSDDELLELYKDERIELSAKISELRKNLKTANGVAESVAVMQEKIELHKQWSREVNADKQRKMSRHRGFGR